MARRGRPKKIQTEATKLTATDYEKLLKQRDQEEKVKVEKLYKELATIKHNVDLALTHINLIDNCDNIAEAAFKAGRAYGPLDKANDQLAEILDDIYGEADVDHWEDVINEN